MNILTVVVIIFSILGALDRIVRKLMNWELKFVLI